MYFSLLFYNHFMSEKCAIISSVIVSILLLVVMLISTGEFFCGSSFWFEREFAAHENVIVEEYGHDEAVRVSEETMDYLLGRSKSLDDLRAKGSDKAFYNHRELHHLADCRVLFLGALRMRNILLAVSAIALMLLISLKKGKIFARSFVNTARLSTVIIVAAVVIFAINFSFAYDWIHELLFDNYLWILNPVTDDLVNLMTTDVITETAGIILTTWICLALIIGKVIYRKFVPTEDLITRIRMLMS